MVNGEYDSLDLSKHRLSSLGWVRIRPVAVQLLLIQYAASTPVAQPFDA